MRAQFVMMCLVLFGLMGCSAQDYSMNMRAATVQATATVSTKAVLDEVPIAKYDETKVQLIEVMDDVSRFLVTGKIGDLPLDGAKEAVFKYMIEKGWVGFIPAVEAIFDIVAAQKVPLAKIGEDNIEIIQLGLASAKTSAETSKAEWRRPDMRSSVRSELPPNRVRVYRK